MVHASQSDEKRAAIMSIAAQHTIGVRESVATSRNAELLIGPRVSAKTGARIHANRVRPTPAHEFAAVVTAIVLIGTRRRAGAVRDAPPPAVPAITGRLALVWAIAVIARVQVPIT